MISPGYDAIVVGGGPAGSSAAINLVRRGIATLLIDDPSASQGVPAEMLPPHVRSQLDRLGVCRSALARLAQPCHGIQALWGRNAPAFHSHIRDPLGHGWHIERSAFRDLLLDTARGVGACVSRPARFLTAEKENVGWTIRLRTASSSREVRADVLIDATGRPAVVTRRFGVRRDRHDALYAVAGVLDSQPRTQLLLVEATSYGWWYLSPVSPTQVLVCLLSDGDEIRKLNATHHPDWLTVMSRTQLISGLVDLDRLRSLRMYPCDTSCLQHAAGEGWLAIGDAVAVWDPLSSGGVSKALRNGEQAAAAIFDELNGDRQAMMRYEDQCARAFTEYLAQRHTHYAIEKRWSADLFWRRRAA